MSSEPAKRPRLKRTLGLWDLVFCGIILIQPTAPMPNFGIIGQDAKGHIVTTILIAMCAMLFTAVSYGRMARAYPARGRRSRMSAARSILAWASSPGGA
jgi:putrescine importer